jgi:hypothetical protein
MPLSEVIRLKIEWRVCQLREHALVAAARSNPRMRGASGWSRAPGASDRYSSAPPARPVATGCVERADPHKG